MDGFHGGEDRERGEKKKGGERRMPPMQSSVREHLPGPHCLLPQTSPLLLPRREREKNARQRNSRSRSARVSERASEPFHAPTGRPSKGSSSFFFARLFVLSFSIGMSTAQTRGTPATYVRRGVVGEGGWGVGVVGQKGGVRRIIGLLAQHFSRWHFHSAGRTCSRLLW